MFPGQDRLQKRGFTNVSYFNGSPLGDKACGIVISKAKKKIL
ncbi:hypothetical protein ADIARSV_0019 [Arcticibacter svalbardensis MN12-7]|uniref:Uncharacterized protein n=1 Tax=Arcticibacter svalbardensis MN12-7 TaxID=1150600 RepID=R9GYD3_9SPHI|nr:hypothetical protein ADIARSV_0019 [Arcticibacter svalbardensis MN12-7]